MREQLSRERLNQLHQALDRQLQSIDHMHLVPTLIAPPSVPSKPAPKTSNTQLEDLQKKLMNLQKKMQKINLSSEEEQDQQSFEIKRNSRQVINQNSSKKPRLNNKVDKQGQISSQKSIKQRQIRSSTKKKAADADFYDSPMKRKYQMNSEAHISPKAKQKKLQKSRNKSYKDNPLSLSRKSIDQMSVRSTRSLNKNLTSAQQYSKIQQLEQDLRRYKQENKKLKIRVKKLEVIEVKYEKLKQNFDKSQAIRKQQKVLIQNYKNKAKNSND